MTSALATPRSGPRAQTDHDPETVRLRLKPKAPATGSVDGGWWPRSWDLAAELPDLLAVLAVRLGRIERVSYHLGEWGDTVHKVGVDGRLVRLDGFRTQHANTVDVLSARERITLLVVPPEMSEHAAHAALMTAAHRGNTDDVESMLVDRTGSDAAADTDTRPTQGEQE
jgi:hypothetical protein